jgi:hypothetical protein
MHLNFARVNSNNGQSMSIVVTSTQPSRRIRKTYLIKERIAPGLRRIRTELWEFRDLGMLPVGRPKQFTIVETNKKTILEPHAVGTAVRHLRRHNLSQDKVLTRRNSRSARIAPELRRILPLSFPTILPVPAFSHSACLAKAICKKPVRELHRMIDSHP